MEWLKKHSDTAIVLTAILSSVLWMNGKFNEIDRRFYKVDAEFLVIRSEMNERFNIVDKRFSEVEKEIAVVKTVLIMKNIMPKELATEQAR